MQKAIGKEASTITALFTYDSYSFRLVSHARHMSRGGRFNWRLVTFDERDNTSTWRGPDEQEMTLTGSDIREPDTVDFTIARDDTRLVGEARRISAELNVSEADAITALMVWLDYAIDALIEDAASYSAEIASNRLLLPDEVFDEDEDAAEGGREAITAE